jgi:predicted nucleic acid-binding protein
MTEQQDARQMLEQAERAAAAGDLASAGELLRGAARLQEEELGPLHPDLANTLNNLAVVAEGTGRWSEAESLYRRAAAIAAAALPQDHPMVVASRQNLEDFCRAHGLSLDSPAAITPTPDTLPPATIAAQPRPAAPTPGRVSPSIRWVATGAVVLGAALLLMLRPWSTRDAPGPAPKPESAASEPAAPRRDDRNTATRKPPAAGGVTVATAQLCRTFSASGRSWRCDPVGQPAGPGPIVFLTRVTSPRDATVVHRWYRGNTLRQSVMLEIEANATEGYRTYSRLTVEEGDWRVEVRSEDGKLLNEQRFTVR